MVSSDFGKLEVMRHLISGEPCAIAGEATAVTAAPAAETFKKSRRFIKSSPCRGVSPYGLKRALAARALTQPAEGAWAGLNTEGGQAKRDNGMTALNKSR